MNLLSSESRNLSTEFSFVIIVLYDGLTIGQMGVRIGTSLAALRYCTVGASSTFLFVTELKSGEVVTVPDLPPPHSPRIAIKPKRVVKPQKRVSSAPKSDRVARHNLKPVKVNPVIDEKPDAT